MIDFILNFLQTPAIVLGLVAFIGLALQRKNFGQIFSGTVKTALGMLIVSAGADIIVEEIIPFSELFSKVFNLTGFATSSEAVVGALQTNVPMIAATSSLIMAIGFLVNIVLARFTPLKYIFLTGHMMWILSVSIATSLVSSGYSKINIILIGSILQGLILVILPAIAQPSVRKLTNSDNFAMGHLTTLGTVSAGYIGGLLGNKENDAEKLELPKSLNFFKDTAISISIVMMVFYIILVLAAGPEVVAEYAGEQNFVVFGLLKGLGFAAGILVLLQGIRLFLGELVPAFKGISDKLVPGAIPALDVPVLFGISPNALMIGFLTSIVGMLIAMGVSGAFLGAIPLVSIIGAFFTGGIAGIFGNAHGGRRGAAIAGLIYGFALIFMSGLFTKLVPYTQFGIEGVGPDTIDTTIVGIIMKTPIIGIAIIVIVFIVLSYLESKRLKKVQSK
ncbi:PTS ascorbate transporter subunit IIC [Aerococcus urinaeequi]|uniref:PTS ascorbate transporter subunit IIC n=1 Tax=Aerococcus urinaeequi TaxID=51665 RepID=UPI00288D1E96|nr:PTS ascorbate transporter subunit IIC [Aerococcus urinaeequi]MDT2762301.1 PTS ascorbate transporter subunit IIC [Aerococcus urinaeequi]